MLQDYLIIRYLNFITYIWNTETGIIWPICLYVLNMASL